MFALPPALGHEEELVGRLVPRRGVGIQLDLGGQVGPGVLLLPRRQRRHLGVAQVEPGVGVEDALRDGSLVGALGEDVLAALAHDDRRAGVLAHREDATGGDVDVLEQVVGDELVVVARLGVLEDRPELGEVGGAEEVGDVVHRRLGEQPERLGCDLEERSGRRVPAPPRRPRWSAAGRGWCPPRSAAGPRRRTRPSCVISRRAAVRSRPRARGPGAPAVVSVQVWPSPVGVAAPGMSPRHPAGGGAHISSRVGA